MQKASLTGHDMAIYGVNAAKRTSQLLKLSSSRLTTKQSKHANVTRQILFYIEHRLHHEAFQIVFHYDLVSVSLMCVYLFYVYLSIICN